MKIVSLHINDYGKFHNQTIDFTKPLKEIYHENGYGKSTIVSFIKTMFYGMATVKSGGKDVKDRKLYYPFSGGSFGGTIVFEFNGETYHLERTFDDKSQTEDTIKLFINNKEQENVSYDIGRELFGLDEESFMKTILIKADSINTSSTGDISRRLHGDVDSSENNLDYKDVIAKLTEASKNYKKTGDKGLINETTSYISSLEQKIKNLEETKEGISSKYGRIAAINIEINSLNHKIEIYNDQEKRKAYLETYSHLVSERDKVLEELEELKKKYPKGLPTLEEIENLNKLITELDITLRTLKEKELSQENLTDYNFLAVSFKNGVPTNEEISEQQFLIKKLDENNHSIQNAKEQVVNQEILKRFDGREPSPEQISKNQDKYNELLDLDKTIRDMPVSITSAPIKQSNNKKQLIVCIILCLLGFGALVGGIILFVNKLTLFAVLCLAVGGFLFGAVLFTLFYKPKGNQSVAGNPALEELRKKQDKLNTEISMFLARFNYDENLGAIANFSSFLKDYEIYQKEKEASSNSKETITVLEEDNKNIKLSLDKYFHQFNLIGDNYNELLTKLISNIKEYELLFETKKVYDKKLEEYNALKDNVDKSKQLFIEKYGIAVFVYDVLRKDIEEYARLTKELESKEIALKDYLSEKGNINSEETFLDINVEECKAKLAQLNKTKALFENEIQNAEDEVASLDDINNELELQKDLLKDYKARYKLINDTISFIKEAEESINNKYIAPIYSSFSEYSEKFAVVTGKKIIIGNDFKMSYEEKGKIHDIVHLSSGESAALMLCLRFALIDNMFKDDKPFIILDDPLLTLDEKNLDNAKELIRLLSEDNQIIYLTCHNSRRIEK